MLLVTWSLLLLVDWEMNPNEKRDLLELALQSFLRVLDNQQNRMISNGAVRPDRVPSDAFPNWVQWKLHFVAVAEATRWTDIQAINALPVCLNGHALDNIVATPTELKQPVNGEPYPTLRALFEHLYRVLGVMRNDRSGRYEFKALAQKEGESLREVARRVRSIGSLVFAHRDVDERDERLREQFLEGLSDPDIFETLLREEVRSFSETVSRAIDLESISRSIRSHRDMRTTIARVVQEASTSSSPRNLNDLKEQMNGLMVTIKNITKVMTQFVLTYGDIFRDYQLRQ